VAFKLLVLDRMLEEDSVTGDAYGPFDAETAERERARLNAQKARPPDRAAARRARTPGARWAARRIACLASRARARAVSAVLGRCAGRG